MDDDDPPRMTLAEMQAALDRSEADLAAGRVVPFEDVIAMLDAAIAKLERARQKAAATQMGE